MLRSVMMTINGRLNLKTGGWLKDISVMVTPVAAVAVAPASSTSRVALCTTYSAMEAERDDRWMGYREGSMCLITYHLCPYL